MQIERMLKIRDLMNKHDPQGLLASGAPTDEYESEAIFLANFLDDSYTTQKAVGLQKADLLRHYMQPEYFRSLVYASFLLYFGLKLAGLPADYHALADDLRALWIKECKL